MTEKKLWQRLKRLLPMVDWQRIETITASGVPDVNGCVNKIEFWLELKILTGVKSLSFQSPLKPLQSAWLLKRWKAGGRTFILAAYDDEIWVWPGCFGPMLVANRNLQEFTCLKLKKPWNKSELLGYFRDSTPAPDLSGFSV